MILSEARTITETQHFLSFEIEGERGCGWSFPCDPSGNLFPLHSLGKKNLRECQEGHCQGHKVVFLGIKELKNTYRSPAVLRCACGSLVELSDPLSNCVCGRCYNLSGSLLG